MKKTVIHKTVRGNRKINLSGICKLLIFAAVCRSFGGCVKDDLYNTPHPDKGAVRVTTDWTGRSSDATLPESYVLRIGDREQTVSGVTNAFDALFPPGKQDLLVYHQTEGITISGTTATVNTLADGTLEPMPGYLFSGAEEPDIAEDDTVSVTVPMKQHIRALTLTLKLKPGDEQRISGTHATLSGIASVTNLADGSLTAVPGKTTVPVFVLGTEGSGTRAASQPALTATLRLMGATAGEKQLLTLEVALTNGTVQTVVTDLTEILKDFATGDMEPLTPEATLELPTEAGFTASITGWTVVDNGNIDIH